MTQPTEAYIRAACEEAGVEYEPQWRVYWTAEHAAFVEALARRIAAEAENARLREVLQALDLEIEKHGFSSTGIMRRLIATALEETSRG